LIMLNFISRRTSRLQNSAGIYAKIGLIVSVALILCLTIRAPGAAFAADHARAAVVDEIKGTVRATQNELEMPAFRGLALLRGDGLAVGAESWSRLELDEGRFAIVEENTDIQISALADGLTGERVTRVFMSEGKVWFDVSRQLEGGESFEVFTPTCALTVRGTIFSVKFLNNATSFDVFEGEIAVSFYDDGELRVIILGSGEKATVAFNLEIGTAATVTQGELNMRDLEPFREGADEGPGGVYEALRDQVSENEEFTAFIEQIFGVPIETLAELFEQPIDEFTDQVLDQTAEQITNPTVDQLTAQAPLDGLEDMTYEEMMQVIDLLKGGPAFPDTLLDISDLVISNPLPPGDPVSASITGRLQAGVGNDGIYSFNIDLGSGAITNGTMSGQYGDFMTYDLKDGAGFVSGNNFSLSDFLGSVTDSGYSSPFYDVNAALDGVAGNGFDNLGDLDASGTFEIIYGDDGVMYEVNGIIYDGWRTQ